MSRAANIAFSLLLALVLVVGYVPVAALAFADAAWADEAGQAEGGEAGGDPGADPGADPGSGADPGTDPGADPGTNPGTDPGTDLGSGTNPGADPQPDRRYVEALMLKWDKPDDDGLTHFVGDYPYVEDAYKQVKVEKKGEQVQLNAYYLSTDGSGVPYATVDSSTQIGSFDVTWLSSDEAVATVTPNGLVTPRGNGAVTITATVADPAVYQGAAPAVAVTVVFDGQEGEYVSKVQILEEDGSVIGQDWGGVYVYTEENTFHQLQALVTWVDADGNVTRTEQTGTGDVYSASNVSTTLVWNVSSSNTFTINADTGRLRCGAYSGNAFVTCTAPGAGVGGRDIEDTANVQMDTGSYEYNPADSLTLRLVYQERPDQVVKEETFSYADLLGRLPSQRINATIMNAQRYGVISAEGFLFKDVVKLINVDDRDVFQFRFGTADGYDNPVSYTYLFESGQRYYFPNYDLGGSKAEGQVVPPLLAYRSTLMWNAAEADPSRPLDEGTRFRLVFGCLYSGDANTSFQIYYISSITVVLDGGPSAGGGGGTGTGGENEGSGGSGGDGTGGSGGGRTGTSDEGGADSGNQRGPAAGAEQAAGESDNISGNAEAAEAARAADAGGDVGASKKWRVYQMMNKLHSDVPEWDDENPFEPFTAPIAVGAMVVGAGATSIGFRRRLL